jgi:hypothetical protein
MANPAFSFENNIMNAFSPQRPSIGGEAYDKPRVIIDRTRYAEFALWVAARITHCAAGIASPGSCFGRC